MIAAPIPPALAALVTVYLGWHFQAMPPWFFGHIIAMLVCWCLMVSGSSIFSYMRAFSPPIQEIAAHKKKYRILHGVMQTAACLLAIVGYCCMYHQHSAIAPSSQLGLDPNNAISRIAHVWVGYVIILAMLVQGCQGWLKYVNIMSYPLHKNIGIATISVTGVNVCIILSNMIKVHDMSFWLIVIFIMGASVAAGVNVSISQKQTMARMPQEEYEPKEEPIDNMYSQLASEGMGS